MRGADPHQMLVFAGGLLLAVAIWLASYFIALTPGRVLDDNILESQTPPTESEAVSYTLPEGASAADVGKGLQDLGVIRSGRQFEVLATLIGVHDKLSAGDYTLERNSPVPLVLQRVTVQESIPVLRVTFPEGIRIEEMAVIAEEAGFGTADEFLAAVAAAELPPEFAASLPAGHNKQGYLFPDTYILPEGSTAADLVEEMIEILDERFSPELRAAVAEQGLTLHQALTFASIVEREAVLDDERPIIADVFLNRFADGVKLDADPTVQFAVALQPASVEEFGYWKLELTLDDLAFDSPYNTYIYPGLPPGPIANPGLASIEAVANPADTGFYYFVADAVEGDGSHLFAETLEQHNQNVAEVRGE